MIIKALMENTTQSPAFLTEHGLSLYIETGDTKILFDSGQSSAFAKNAEQLGVDLSAVDFAVLSHGHYDHSGGLQTFLSLNQHAPIYLSQYAFDEYVDGIGKYIGVDPALQKSSQLVFVKSGMQISPGLELFTDEGFTYRHPIQPYGLCVRRDNKLIPDNFRHEQYLLITEGSKRILISGCSHRGIVNINSWLTPDILIGGFHFMKLDPDGDGKTALDTAAKELMAFSTRYHTCHCTGVAQYEYLKPLMKDQLQYLSCGQEIVL